MLWYLDSQLVLVSGLIPGIRHGIAARAGFQSVPVLALMQLSHSSLRKEDLDILALVLNAIGRHAKPALEGHQDRACMVAVLSCTAKDNGLIQGSASRKLPDDILLCKTFCKNWPNSYVRQQLSKCRPKHAKEDVTP